MAGDTACVPVGGRPRGARDRASRGLGECQHGQETGKRREPSPLPWSWLQRSSVISECSRGTLTGLGTNFPSSSRRRWVMGGNDFRGPILGHEYRRLWLPCLQPHLALTPLGHTSFTSRCQPPLHLLVQGLLLHPHTRQERRGAKLPPLLAFPGRKPHPMHLSINTPAPLPL